jgi:hypothetical protein
MAAGIDSAQEHVAAAEARAREIAARAAASGFTGIAVGMSRIQGLIGEIRTRLAGVGNSINEMVTAVAAAPRETSPEQAVAALSPALEQVGGIRAGVAATIGKVDESKQLAAAVLRGGRPGPMLSALDSVKQVLVLVTQRGGTARQHVEIALGEVQQMGGWESATAGGWGSPTAGGGASSPPPVATRQPPEQRWPGYPARRSLSLADRRQIVYGDEDDPTSGGHLHGRDRPEKTEFPPDWDEDKIAQEVTSVADDPDRVAERPGRKWLAVGVRDGVTIQAILRHDGSIVAGHPVGGPGVKKNPPSGGA